MFLAGMFIAGFARSLASPVPIDIPASTIPSPLCVITAAFSEGTCDPSKRRTVFDILYSCLGVIFLCTYISVHHNIPDQNDSWTKKTLMKIRTMLYAMLAPEIVIMWALRQRIMAGKIATMNRTRKWTRAHGFFIQMGGLMLKVEEGRYEVAMWNGHAETITTNSGLRGFEVPLIRRKEIEDHGKGDVLSKTIVVLQTTWFVIQCISRHVDGLVLTELELVTLAFAALNIMTYILWWDKPLNVEYPIYFDHEGKRVDGPEEREEEAWYGRLRKMETGKRSQESSEKAVGLLRRVRESIEANGLAKAVWNDLIMKSFGLIFGPLLEMTHEEGDGWKRATSVPPFYAAWLSPEHHQFTYRCAAAIGVVFGAIHLVGWNFPFSTATELWLWRLSSLILTITPVFVALGSVDDTLLPDYLAEFLWFLTIRIGSPFYIAARTVVLFLAFLALRDLPDSAYENVRWSEFVPHI
ncbi:hypothetical protein AX16_008312 [Volvariella volvacea WC 439]|nr:hypothetical protein AX16_008312 [Volvariella volvacea WC 439]